MKINTYEELYRYLNDYNFEAKKETALSSVFFAVKYNDRECERVEPIYFYEYDGAWFPAPCELRALPLKDDDLGSYVHAFYKRGNRMQAWEYEKTMQRNGWHYEIYTPQCSPFLPEEFEIIDAISESQCLDWLLSELPRS